jgi:hypothetical protein
VCIEQIEMRGKAGSTSVLGTFREQPEASKMQDSTLLTFLLAVFVQGLMFPRVHVSRLRIAGGEMFAFLLRTLRVIRVKPNRRRPRMGPRPHRVATGKKMRPHKTGHKCCSNGGLSVESRMELRAIFFELGPPPPPSHWNVTGWLGGRSLVSGWNAALE